METTVTQLTFDDLQAGLIVRYGEEGKSFAIPGSKLTDWVLQQFVEMKREQVAANLN